MPIIQPSRADVHINRPLTNLSIAVFQDPTNFIAAQMFPTIPVMKQSDLYWILPADEFNRDEMEERAPATESSGGGWSHSHDNYFARKYSFHHDIPDEVRANYDSELSADNEAMMYVTFKAQLKRETSWVTKYFTGGNPGVTWTFTASGVATGATAIGSFDATSSTNNKVLQWSDPASTPIEDVRRAKTTMLERTGYEPNVMAIQKKVYDILLDHPDIIERINSGQTPGGPAKTQKETLAALFELDEILVLKSIKNSAQRGQAAVTGFTAGKNVLLAYRAKAPGLMTASAGYTFGWNGLFPGGRGGIGNAASGDGLGSDVIIKKIRMELKDADRVEISMAFDQKVVSKDLGYLFYNIVA